MQPNPALGVVLHAVGGLAAASFYIPYRGVRGWSWENYWLLGGVFSWIVAPWMAALLLVPNTLSILAGSGPKILLGAWLFGVLWGVGGLTFGLSMRYLGIALGYAIALGLCAAFGTLVPPLFRGELGTIAQTTSGQVILLGVMTCLIGIALSGVAGMRKERELPDEQKRSTTAEFSFWKGLLVAMFAGVLSASMSYGLAYGKPIALLAVRNGAPALWQNLPVFVVVLLGGFTTNGIWCLALIRKRRKFGEYLRGGADGGAVASPAVLTANYFLCATAGIAWYLQFFFYGMGTTQMGPYDFSSWTLHMGSIIFFSTCWGIMLKEWRGTSKATHGWIAGGLGVLVLSILVIGHGNRLAVREKSPPPERARLDRGSVSFSPSGSFATIAADFSEHVEGEPCLTRPF